MQLVTALLAVLLVAQAPIANAASLSELKNQKSQVEKKKSELKSEINKKESSINSIKNKQENLKEQIQKITQQVTETSKKIDKVNTQIEKKNAEIQKIQVEIDKLQEKIDQRDALLKERARAIQANGEISYIDVLLGAESFVDFIDRFSAVNTLIEADRQIMKEQKEDKRKLEEDELELQNAKKDLENQKSKLKNLVTSLNQQEKEKNSLIAKLEKESKNLAAEKALLQEQYEEAVELSQEINNKIAAEQAKIVKQMQSSRSSGSGGSGSGGSADYSDYKVAAGDWTNPASGYLTSNWGGRTDPINGGAAVHWGIDIARRGANVPVYAAATGVVSYAGPLSTYGNVVMITHNMGGKIYTSLYAHLSGFSVSVGQAVKKGQRIATMGTTGRSTGQHLHFEIHSGTWKGQKVGNLNPLGFIPGGFKRL